MLVLSLNPGNQVRIGPYLLTVISINRRCMYVGYRGKTFRVGPRRTRLDSETEIVFKYKFGSQARFGLSSPSNVIKRVPCGKAP